MTRKTEQQPQDPFPPCPHCEHGLVTVPRVETIADRALWPHEVAGLGVRERAALGSFLTLYALLAVRQPSRTPPYVVELLESAACLCPAGRAKLLHVSRLVGLERVVPQDEIDRLWPSGVPQANTPTAALEAAGILPLCWDWTLENYKRKFGRDRTSRDMLAQATRWLETPISSRTDVVIFGGHGMGKSGLAIGMLIAGTERGERVRYEDARRLFMGWRETFQEGSDTPESEYLRQWETVPVLVIDEVQEGSDKSRPVLQMLVDRRQKTKRPTVLILNLPEDMADVTAAAPFLSQTLGPALMDRLREKAQFWALFGKSRRQPLSLAFSKDHDRGATS